MSLNSTLESVAPYIGITITLGVAGTRQNLLTLLRALDSHCPSTCRELNIQYDPVQAGANGSLLIGDSLVAVSPQRCSFNELAGGSAHYGAGAESRQVYIANIWLVASEMDEMLVNVEVQN